MQQRQNPLAFVLRACAAALLLVATLGLAIVACGDDSCGADGTEGGPMCCNDGCGRTTVNPLPSVCQSGVWKCQGSNPVRMEYCAYEAGSCQARTACTSEVGLGNDEQDPAPELCCKGGCGGTTVLHRTCVKGTTYDCPSGAVEISRCPDPYGACGGALGRYRANGHKLPLP